MILSVLGFIFFIFGGNMDSESFKNNKLRTKAEEISRNKSYPVDDLSKDELIEELRVHQIELELQNGELQRLSDRISKFTE